MERPPKPPSPRSSKPDFHFIYSHLSRPDGRILATISQSDCFCHLESNQMSRKLVIDDYIGNYG